MYLNPETLSNQSNYASDLIFLTEEQEAMYIQYSGFVTVKSTDPVIIEPDIEAWEKRKAEQPAPKPETPNMAVQMQAAMMAFAATSASIPDTYAVDMPDLFPTWEDVLSDGNPLAKGAVINDGGQLYRVNQDQTIPQEHQPPHGEGMTAVYVPINKTHAGTLDDPIPAVKGMEYTYGLYYLDPEDQKIYLCKRTGEADGGTIVLQYLPHDLVGHYFVLYE